MGKSRAERRHHHQRMIDKVKNFHWLKPEFWHSSEEKRQKHIKKMAETRHPCSCDMCCNPRRSPLNKEKLTMQEIKSMKKMQDEF